MFKKNEKNLDANVSESLKSLKEKNKINKKEDQTHEITFDLTSLANQASGVIATVGGTSVFCTTVVGKEIESDFLPLSVHYIERYSAVNRLPGGYKKREGASADHEILITRAIDRCLRAILPSDFSNEIQVVLQVLSYDGYSIEALGVCAASVSLNLAQVTNKLVAASSVSQDFDNKAVYKFNSVQDGYLLQGISDDKIVMAEYIGGMHESSLLKSAIKNSVASLKEMQVKGAVIAKSLIKQQKEALKNINHKFDKNLYSSKHLKANEIKLIEDISNELSQEYLSAMQINSQIKSKHLIQDIMQKFNDAILNKIGELPQSKLIQARKIFEKIIELAVSTFIFKEKKRLDGRKFNEIRPISMKSGFINALHGSALFSRGDTQALVSVAVASQDSAQTVESLNGLHKEHFLLHYNFLPYSVGEIGKVGGASRREVGHGELARRAFLSNLPKLDYTLRAVSEITSSNGSSSMATVCATSLAMFDAGVPLDSHIAGISIGLFEKLPEHKKSKLLSKLSKKNYALLVDITANEDAYGKMDFKIVGTKDAITAMQLDIKNDGISQEVFEEAIILAHTNIKKIITMMNKEIKKPSSLNSIPTVIKIDPSKVRLVIGKNGSTINEITKECGVKIDLDKFGKVTIINDINSQVHPDIKKAIEKIEQVLEK